MENAHSSLIPYETKVPAKLSAAEWYLERIRPEWQATTLDPQLHKLSPDVIPERFQSI